MTYCISFVHCMCIYTFFTFWRCYPLNWSWWAHTESAAHSGVMYSKTPLYFTSTFLSVRLIRAAHWLSNLVNNFWWIHLSSKHSYTIVCTVDDRQRKKVTRRKREKKEYEAGIHVSFLSPFLFRMYYPPSVHAVCVWWYLNVKHCGPHVVFSIPHDPLWTTCSRQW